MKIKPTKKVYQTSDLTITWEPHKCIHSEKCWRNLPEVFRYGQKPWIDPEGASTNQITERIDGCPSGALGYEKKNSTNSSKKENTMKVQVAPNGPLIIKGEVEIEHNSTTKTHKNAALCRCGSSSNKPFCDGTHVKVGFEG